MFTLPKAFSRGPEKSLGGVGYLAVLECVVLLFPQPALPPVGKLLLEEVALLNDVFPLESEGLVLSEGALPAWLCSRSVTRKTADWQELSHLGEG